MSSKEMYPEYDLTDEEWENIFYAEKTSNEVRRKIFHHETKLLSCPFCGAAEGHIVKHGNENRDDGIVIYAHAGFYNNGNKNIVYMIKCSCGAMMGDRNVSTWSFFTKLDDCIEAWNNQAGFESRKEITEPVQEFFVRSCRDKKQRKYKTKIKQDEEYGLTEEEWEKILNCDTEVDTKIIKKILHHKTKPLPCPFCGSTVSYEDPETGKHWGYTDGISLCAHPFRCEDGHKYIICTVACTCGARMGEAPNDDVVRSIDNIEECIKAWNNRAAEPRKKVTGYVSSLSTRSI